MLLCQSYNSAKAHLVHQLRSCKDLVSATWLHSIALKCGLLSDVSVPNHLINCYVRLREIGCARNLFDEMPEHNVVSWTSLIAGYVNTGHPNYALWMYQRMCQSWSMPNAFTYATAINACSLLADHEIGKKLHAHVEVLGFKQSVVVCSALVDMYGKCNDVDQARRVFDSMDYNNRNVVLWNSMIATYVQNGRGNEALQVFRDYNCWMLERPNHFMLTSVVSACASLGRLVLGKVTHGAVIRGGYELKDVVASALLDMYAKCGCFSYSEKVFRRIPNPSAFSYSTMIVGAAKYGHGEQPLRLFEEMIDKGMKPNDVTFVGVLHACSHAGLVDEGLGHLHSMYYKHGIMPVAKHYACAVDMLSRIGRLDEAYKLALSIEVNPSQGAMMWGTLLSASRLQGRVDFAAEASKRLIESQQQVAYAYVTLSNTYGLAGEWEKSQSLRTELKRAGMSKEPGCSWVEIKDSMYVFYAGDLSCEGGEEILCLLRELERRMIKRGYVNVGGSTGFACMDVEEEAKEEMVTLHSERLALGFGLLNMSKGATIRIMKNLRICRECHEAFKLISEIIKRDFVVRDINRFHHFKNGFCTCRDFW